MTKTYTRVAVSNTALETEQSFHRIPMISFLENSAYNLAFMALLNFSAFSPDAPGR